MLRALEKWPPISFALETADVYGRVGMARTAAALSYYLIMTLFPLLMCVNYLIGLLPLDAQQIFSVLDPLLPRDSLNIILDYLTYVSDIPQSQTVPLLLACLFTIVLSASAGMRTLLQAMDELYERAGEKPVQRVIFSVALSLIFLLTIYLSIVVIFTGEWFFQALNDLLPKPLLVLLPPLPSLSAVWRWLRYLLLFCVVLLLVLVIYRAGTPRAIRGRRRGMLRLTATISALGMVACSVLFSWFIDMSSRYSLVYGSLASIIILLVWLYFCGNILMLGAVLGRVWVQRHPENH